MIPYQVTMAELRRKTCNRPRSDKAAGTANMRAAALMRAATAAAGDQPASIRDRANEPDVLKVAADSNARAIPAPRACIRDIGAFRGRQIPRH
jgi:hypothetical protein